MESTQVDLGSFEELPPLVIPPYPEDAGDYMDPLYPPTDEEADEMELDYHRTYGGRGYELADTEDKVFYRRLVR